VGAGLGAVAAALILWPHAEPLRFTVGDPGAAGVVGTWVAAGEVRAAMAFSDGTSIVLEPGARARVASVGEHGAHVVLERGRISANVVPRRGNAWFTIAGPFEIQVTGTRFDASWDPVNEELFVLMHEGHVVVRGTCLDHERSLSTGETERLACAPTGGSRLSGLGADALGVPAVAAYTPRDTAPADKKPNPVLGHILRVQATETNDKAQDAPETPPTFWELGRRGEYQRALDAAEALGFNSLCETLSASDLLELGTTARLAKHGDRAVIAYGALRRRFRGSEPAATAAFLLGQMAFDGAHNFGEAHRWFETYLAERPSGVLAAEALGRRMEAEKRLGHLTAARATAARYLGRFPGSAHAALAQSLLTP
jgi:TolA-binding protein